MNSPNCKRNVRSRSRSRHKVVVSFPAQVFSVNSLNKITNRNGDHVHVDGEFQLPCTHLRIAIDAWKPQPRLSHHNKGLTGV